MLPASTKTLQAVYSVMKTHVPMEIEKEDSHEKLRSVVSLVEFMSHEPRADFAW